MGNEQSMDPKGTRRSMDTTAFERQARSAQSTPRISLSGPRLVHKNSDGLLTPSPNIKKHHRLSVEDCSVSAERRQSRSRSSAADNMGNQQPRRVSRSTVSFGENADVGFTVQEYVKLSPYQCQLICSTWPKIRSNHNVFTQIFKLLCFKSTLAREIFQKLSIVEGFKSDGRCDLQMHAKTLSELMDFIISDLNQSVKNAQLKCAEVGSGHHNVNERMVGTLWESLGECIAEVITKVDCVRSKREAVKGYISLVSFMVDSMKNGYTSEFRRRHAQRGSVTRLNQLDD